MDNDYDGVYPLRCNQPHPTTGTTEKQMFVFPGRLATSPGNKYDIYYTNANGVAACRQVCKKDTSCISFVTNYGPYTCAVVTESADGKHRFYKHQNKMYREAE